ncbi:hypothetical protein [Foetidibacter luteolus]|uniref:hypothetical protein n=1 Tax=Foetidibacter luteolus TaxID=2608880 RepID=UPI00129B9A87|nr:hypothetical protein [Foetidibacter luteolus]
MKQFLSLLIICLSFTSCVKQTIDIFDGDNPDDCPVDVDITATTLTPNTGEDIILTAKPANVGYNWTGPSGSGIRELFGNNIFNIYAIKIKNSGWYYCQSVTPGCNPVSDSIYIDVKYKQGNPPCALTNNHYTGTSMPDVNAPNVRKSFDETRSSVLVDVSGGWGSPTLRIIFNPSIGNSEPKDGVYTTIDGQSFDSDDDNDAIFVSCLYSNVYMACRSGQSVYISHTSGKLTAAFCSLKVSGDIGWGPIVADLTGQVTENQF